jgi:hypothetical protein
MAESVSTKDPLVVKKQGLNLFDVFNSSQGLLKVKQNFTTRERYIELDELNEYVSLYSVSRDLEAPAKMRLVGNFSLEGAGNFHQITYTYRRNNKNKRKTKGHKFSWSR